MKKVVITVKTEQGPVKFLYDSVNEVKDIIRVSNYYWYKWMKRGGGKITCLNGYIIETL